MIIYRPNRHPSGILDHSPQTKRRLELWGLSDYHHNGVFLSMGTPIPSRDVYTS